MTAARHATGRPFRDDDKVPNDLLWFAARLAGAAPVGSPLWRALKRAGVDPQELRWFARKLVEMTCEKA